MVSPHAGGMGACSQGERGRAVTANDGGLVKKCVNARQAAAFWVDDSVDTSPPST